MISKDEEKLKIEELKKEIKEKQEELNKLESNYFTSYKLEEIRKQYLNKYFVFKNNSYSCPQKREDYWDVYYKVIDVTNQGGIKAVSLEKDCYGKIESSIEIKGIGYLNLKEITEKEYITETSKILGVLEERFKIIN